MRDTPDVAVVLPVHAEGRLMVPTLRALARSISHAASGAGIRTEVVIVQDRADRETTNALAAALANGALLSASVVRTVIVDHGDLSLARNEGVRASLPCASGWGETPALLTFALHGARTDQY